MTTETNKHGRQLCDQAKGRISARHFEVIAVVTLLLVAAVLRTTYLLQYKEYAPCYSAPMMDSQYYDLWAQKVASGEGYGPKPFYMAPLYPYVLAVFYRIFGHTLAVVYIFQTLLGVANLLLVFLIGRKVFGYLAGLSSIILLLSYAPLMYLESKVLTETLSLTLNLLSILALIYASSRPSALRYLGAGVLLGLGVLCRPNVIIFVVLVIVWLWFEFRGREGCEERLRNIVLIVVGVVVTIMPVTVRNYVVGKDIVLISSNAGINFAQGNLGSKHGIFSRLEGFSGSVMTQEQEEHAIAESELGHAVKASESSSFWFKKTVDYIVEHPGLYLRLIGRKILWSLHSREAPCNYNLYLESSLVPVLRYMLLPFWLLLGLGVFGFVSARIAKIDGSVNLLSFYILSVFLTLVIFSVSSRFRVPMTPALAIFAGFGAVQILRRFSAKKLGIVIVCIAPALLISRIPYPMPIITSEALANLGVSYLSNGNVGEAKKRLEEALKADPDFAYAHINLGTALAMEGNLEEAARHFSEAIRIFPNSVEAHSNLGSIFAMQGKFDEALAHFTEAVRLNPNSAEVLNNLGNVQARLGDFDGAAESYSKALRINPRFSQAHASLGDIFIRQGRINEALEHYKSAVEANPDDLIMRYKLANILLRLRRFDEAVYHYRKILDRKPDLGRVHNNLAVALFFKGDYAEAWKEVRLSEKYGVKPAASFLKGLAKKMPEPYD